MAGRKRKLRNCNYESRDGEPNFGNGPKQEQSLIARASLQLSESAATSATDMSLLKETVVQLCKRMTALENSYLPQGSETRVPSHVEPPPLPNLLAIMGSLEKMQKRESPEVEILEPSSPRKRSSSSSAVERSVAKIGSDKKIHRSRAGKEAVGKSPDSSYFSDVCDSGVGGSTPASTRSANLEDLPWTGFQQQDLGSEHPDLVDDLAQISSTLPEPLVPETFAAAVQSVAPEPDAELIDEFLNFCQPIPKVDASTGTEVSKQEVAVQTCCGSCNSGSCIEPMPSSGSNRSCETSSSNISSAKSRSSSKLLKLPVFAQLIGIKVEKHTAPRCYVDLQGIGGEEDLRVGDHWMRRFEYSRNGQKTSRWLLVHQSNRRKLKLKKRKDQILDENNT